MQDGPALVVDGLSKTYTIQFLQRNVLLKQLVLGLLGGGSTEVRALDGIDFTLGRGEALGVIGPNGSGKTTLLKAICGLTNLAGGKVRRNGRTVGMLALGAGFQPTLSGRENIRLYGLVLGLTHEQITACEEQIIAFAELGKYIDAPVKAYSAGMSLRLGFACAVHAEPDILVVDEVIEVGDAGFKSRCFDRIRELRDGGCSLILATHTTEHVRTYCDSLLHLDEGRQRAHVVGAPAVARYLDELFGGAPGDDGSLRETLNYQAATERPGALTEMLEHQREMLTRRLPTLSPAEREALLGEALDAVVEAGRRYPDDSARLLRAFAATWLALLELVDGSTLLKLWERMRLLLRDLLPVSGTLEERVALLEELAGMLRMEPGPIKVTLEELRDLLRPQLAERILDFTTDEALAEHHALLERLERLGGEAPDALQLDARLVDPIEGKMVSGDPLVVAVDVGGLTGPTRLVVELTLFAGDLLVARSRALVETDGPLSLRWTAERALLPTSQYRLIAGAGREAPSVYRAMAFEVDGGDVYGGEPAQLAGVWSRQGSKVES